MSRRDKALARRVERIVKAVGEMPAFPGEMIGLEYNDETGVERDQTLNEWMANTWIAERWPALLRRAAEAAAEAIDRAATP